RATWLESEAGVRTARENILKTRAALTLPLEPPEGKGLGYAPPGLEQNHPSVRAALSEMVVLGAQLGIELPRDVETPDQLLERLHTLPPAGEYEELARKRGEDAPAIKVATADKEQAEADLAQARLDLRYTDVTAEIDGAITRLSVHEGNNVQVGQSLM